MTVVDIAVSDTQTIEELIPSITNSISPTLIPHITQFNEAEVVELEKEVLLLHLPLPDNVLLVLIDHGPLLEPVPQQQQSLLLSTPTNAEKRPSSQVHKELLKKYALHFMVPHKSGWLMKRGDAGPIETLKLWKKRWFVLRKDKLYYYKKNTNSQFINFISIQSILNIHLTKPFDSVSRKNCSFQLNTPGRIYYLSVESAAEGTSWIQTLTQWLQFRQTFGPENIKATMKMLKSPYLQNLLQTEEEEEEEGKEPKEIEEQQLQQQPIKTTDQQQNETKPEITENLQVINVLLKDGTLKELQVNSNLEVFDLVAVIARLIGPQNVHQMTHLDHDEDRLVEILDHQKTLAEQVVPMDAIFVLKKTGILTDLMASPFDIYDNHFLYVQLPQIQGYLLRKLEDSAESKEQQWQPNWAALRGNRVFFYLDKTRKNFIHSVPLFQVTGVSTSSESEEEFFQVYKATCEGSSSFFEVEILIETQQGCGLELQTKKGKELLLARNSDQRDKWLYCLQRWKGFLKDDGRKVEPVVSFDDEEFMEEYRDADFTRFFEPGSFFLKQLIQPADSLPSLPKKSPENNQNKQETQGEVQK